MVLHVSSSDRLIFLFMRTAFRVSFPPRRQISSSCERFIVDYISSQFSLLPLRRIYSTSGDRYSSTRGPLQSFEICPCSGISHQSRRSSAFPDWRRGEARPLVISSARAVLQSPPLRL